MEPEGNDKVLAKKCENKKANNQEWSRCWPPASGNVSSTRSSAVGVWGDVLGGGDFFLVILSLVCEIAPQLRVLFRVVRHSLQCLNDPQVRVT